MCDYCHLPTPSSETRRSFLRKLTAGLAVSSGMLWTRRALAQSATAQSGGAGWGRLVTPSPFWNLHGEQDTTLADFIRQQTHLDLDPKGYSVNPANLAELSSFPLIFTNDLTAVTDTEQLANIKEYLNRGGFFYVDACVDHRVTRSFPTFLSRHVELFAKLAPGSEVLQILPSNAIFRAYFSVDENQLGHEIADADPRWGNTPQALCGVYLAKRMISLISLDHLQCEWITKPERVPLCMRQIANIYVYAMTR
jgi:hypothetical protein